MTKASGLLADLGAFAPATPFAPNAILEQSVARFADVAEQGKRNLEAVSSSTGVLAKSAEALGAHHAGYYKAAFETYVAQVNALTSAGSMQKAVELQISYAKASTDAFLAFVNTSTEIVSAAMKETARPLSERIATATQQIND